MKPILLLLTVAAVGAAQEPPEVRVHVAPGEAQKVVGVVPHQVEFLSMEFGSAGVVKNAPYSAEAATETTQMLADGNRIQRRSTATLYRDSQGRTRREQSLDGIGPWAPAGEPLQTIFINDPVAGVNFVLDPRTRTARKGTITAQNIKGLTGQVVEVEVFEHAVAPPKGVIGGIISRRVETGAAPEGQTESLGKRLFDGVEAEGKRVTTTIPAGQIGNDRPIEIVSETWYSPQLQVTVYSRRSDPRFGETVYRLTNINRREPLASLFQVPPDYTTKEGQAVLRFDRKAKE